MKKIFASILAALMLVSVVPAALAVDTSSFTDVPTTHWAFNEIEQAVDKGITNGYADGTFKPANSVTKNQFAVMLSRAFFPEDVAANQEIDDGQPWYWANLKALNDRGLLKGTNLTDPDNWATRGGYSINRYEMAVLMYNILGEFGKSANAADMTAAQSKMSDWRFISPDYQDAVAACYALGVLSGYSDGTFSGEKPMNRAQGCVVISRLENYIENGTTTTEPETPVDEEPVQEPETPTEDETPAQTAGTLANGMPATEENVLAILDELKEEYPEGSSWGENDRYTSSVLGSGRECAGYAYMISDRIFGTLPQRTHKNYYDIKPGDIIEQKNSSGQTYHWSVVTTSPVDADGYFRTTGGNVGGGLVTWEGFGTAETMEAEGYSIIHTRYPA